MSSLFPYNRFNDNNSILQKHPNYNGPQYYGKYRGIVTNNQDPEGTCRLKLQIPSVMGDNETDWALPCIPFMSGGTGSLWIPAVGDVVWVEFENGDPNYPIWVGSFFAPNEAPDNTGTKNSPKYWYQHIFQTPSGLKIILDDGSNGNDSFMKLVDKLGNQLFIDSTNNFIKIQTAGAKPVSLTLNGNTGTITQYGATQQSTVS